MKSILAIGIYIMKYFFGNSVILVNCSRSKADCWIFLKDNLMGIKQFKVETAFGSSTAHLKRRRHIAYFSAVYACFSLY